MTVQIGGTIGIIGGGQLGKMMTMAAKQLGFKVIVLDPSPDCPAASLCDLHIQAHFTQKEAIRSCVTSSDVTTYDIEHIDAEILETLAADGHKIAPSGQLLGIIQSKNKQKKFLSDYQIPTARWCEWSAKLPLPDFPFPMIAKSCTGGYDGRGVATLFSKDQLIAWAAGQTILLEEQIKITKELAVMIARNENGLVVYPVVEMTFDSKAHICDMVIAPAQVSHDIQARATQLSVDCIEALNGTGIFGVELFLTQDQTLVVNEIAPRPHNSGHYTIEGCLTSQFEQHIRAITGLPLGLASLRAPTVMLNLLGAAGFSGHPVFQGAQEALSIEGACLHIYGKSETKPYRKMGHVTIVDSDLSTALSKAKHIKSILKVVSGG